MTELIYSEYNRRRDSDDFVIAEVERLLSRENHPYNHLYIGRFTKLLNNFFDKSYISALS